MARRLHAVTAAGAEARHAHATPAQGSNGASSGQSAGADHSTVRQAQQALKEKGHDPGPVDGIFGPNTQQAVQRFQQSQGIQSSGQLDQQTLAALGVQGNGAMQSKGDGGTNASSSAGLNSSSGQNSASRGQNSAPSRSGSNATPGTNPQGSSDSGKSNG